MSEPLFAVVFDRPDADRNYAWGPFSGFDTAAKFAEFVEAEIDPAHVIPWADAQALPGVRVADPVTELLTWRTSVALPQSSNTCPADCPCRSTPLPARWDKEVVHPTPGDTECPDTLVCCVAATGQPVALWLDDEHREALGLALLDPDAEDDQADGALGAGQ